MKLRVVFAWLGLSVSAAAAPEPSQKEIDVAIAAARGVRDSTDDDRYVDVAGAFVVEEVDVRRELEYARYERTKGFRGVKKRTALEETGEGESSKVVVVPIPDVVMKAIEARDEYIARVPPNEREENSILYAFDNADVIFVYGHFVEARARFTRIFEERGVNDAWGRQAWEKLVSIAVKSHDVDRAEALAAANPSSTLATGVLRGVSFVRADRKFLEKKWAEAARKYEDAVSAAPDHREAPRAAMRAAFAWKQIGENRKATADYELVVRAYDSMSMDTELAELVELACGELAATYAGAFDYAKAAETYDEIASHPRFVKSKRKEAARNAMLLHGAMGHREKALALHRVVSTFPLTPEEKASFDYLAASASHGLATFYTRNKDNAFAAKYALEAAWRVAKEKRAAGDAGARAWLANTVAAWKQLKQPEAGLAPYADYGAEAELALIDGELRVTFEDDTGHHPYITMSAEEVGKAYERDARIADAYDKRLEHVVRTYASPTFVTAAIARRASIYDSLRSRLYECGGSKFKVLPPKLEQLLRQMRSSGNAKLVNQADEIEDAAKEGWHRKRDGEIDANDAIMIRHYAQADALAKHYNVASPEIARARRRLAHFTDLIGEAKMQAWVTATTDPTDPGRKLVYSEGLFVRSRPGLSAFPPMGGTTLTP